jgi:hypothetical protein
MFKFRSNLLVLSALLALPALAHKGHHHGEAPSSASVKVPEGQGGAIERVNRAYLSRVKPVFQKSCFDCHSNQSVYPWYYKVPGAKQLIDSDIAESKEHLDFSHDFPFAGHGTPAEDLQAIADSIQEGDMPPFRYRVFHPSSKLTDEDKKTVLDWVAESQAVLNAGH